MIFDNKYVAMDITNSDVRVMTVTGNKVSQWGSAPLPDGLVKDGIIQNPEAASVVIDTLFKSLKLGKNRVICTVTGLPFLYRTISMPGRGRDLDADAIARAARKEMSLTGEDMYLLWQAMGEQPDKGETEYFVLGVPKISFQPVLDTLKFAKINPFVVGVKPLALARAASLQNVCLASLEKNYFDIVLVANGQVRVVHSISPALNPDDQLGVINEFIDGFNKAVKSFNRDFPQDNLPADTPIVLAGELTLKNGFAAMVQEATGHPASIFVPSTDVLSSIPAEMPPALYMATTGLILKKTQKQKNGSLYQDINVNLLDSLKKPAAKTKFSIGLAGAGLAVVILAVLASQVYGMKNQAEADVASLKLQSTQVKQQLTTLQKVNKDLQATKQTADTDLAKLQAELSAVNSDNQLVVSQKVDYSVRMVGIIGALPEGVDYQEINMHSAAFEVSGRAQDPFDVIGYTQKLEDQEYFPAVRVTQISPTEDPAKVTFGVTAPN